MYIPSSNKVADIQKAFNLIEANGFATIITQTNGTPWASHLPVLLDAHNGNYGELRSHMAKANDQWQHFSSSQEVLVIFSGPHSYISPSWYAAKVTVPTWNYATVHVYGIPKIVDDRDSLRKILDDTTTKYEKHMEQPWRMDLPEDSIDNLMKAIIGFTISITKIETKFKLGQNRSAEDQERMLNALNSSPSLAAQELAAFIMKEKCKN